ncbi:chemotaxis-specific protein-glutamate methyltransferase CheB [Sphingomonas sp.]|uniref:chemotaxis-specific protein-glutamate methyltransferase CheB n=1 Tax=Sphingomonas sp. TaxID=28214 RepID=UPI001D238D30|nr:chemotaxis-specific protein-glutamate methyltransferase CheB [Sphingomonas sp.]MBX9796359.1 chemotaxis-specific protein-glutamate methyltransferase CheB [Sphingomonas sp.]
MPPARKAAQVATPKGPAPARILIVDDSAVARAVIGKCVEANPRFTVASAVSDVPAALSFLAHNRVDIILLDVEMPGIDGLTALPDLLLASHGARVIVVSSICAEGATATIHALSLGAADTLVKPGVGGLLGKFSEVLDEKLSRLVDSGDHLSAAPASPPKAAQRGDFDLIAIGASTGGIHALSQLLRAIPAECRVPMLITQHLPPSFMPYFAAQIAVLAGRPCDVATEHMPVQPGRIVIAPGEAHLGCVRSGDRLTVALSTEKAVSGCMPSVDPMFNAVAEACGARAMGVLLSGMGRDGAIGAQRLSAAGGVIVAQDQASSVVWGMPGAVAKAGLAHAVLRPEEIGRLIATQRRPA